MSSALVFLSYSHADREFVKRLQEDFQSIGLSVCRYEKAIRPGDSVSERIESALSEADYFLPVLSANSISFYWVEREYRAALSLQGRKPPKTGRPRILPIRLDDVDPPVFLRDVKCADFTGEYARGWAELTGSFEPADLRSRRVVGSTGTGILRVGSGTGTAIYLLKMAIAKFRETFPDLPIKETADISEEVIKLVASSQDENSLDVGIVGREPEDKLREFIECQEVFRDPNVLAVYPGHSLWGKESVSEEDILSLLMKEEVFIGRPKGSGQYKDALDWLEPRLDREKAEDLMSRFVAYDIDLAKRWVSLKLGISIFQRVLVRNELSSGEIWAVSLPGDPYRRWYGIWPKKRRRLPVVNDFIAVLKGGLRSLEQGQ